MRIIIGLGQTGISVARYLRQQNEAFIVCDTREVPPQLDTFLAEFEGVPVYCGPLDPSILKKATQLIVSPGIAISTPAIAEAANIGVDIIGDVELFLQSVTTPVVAITGSNGKTTVTHLVTAMAQAAHKKAMMCGNVGYSVLDNIDPNAEFYILEISSFQLETTRSLTALAATCLNVSPNHLDRYPSYQAYIETKKTIYHNAQTAIINLDDPAAWEGINPNVPSITFSIEQKADFYCENSHLIGNDGTVWCQTHELALLGRHNIVNILAAFALGTAMQLPKAAMISAAIGFQSLPHRCERVADIDGVQWVNDSKATSGQAVLAALNSLGKPNPHIILIAGGDAKGAEFNVLTSALANYCKGLIVLGKDAKRVAQAAPATLPVHFVKTIQEAVSTAKTFAKKGDLVLLSPACASWDMFKDYTDRGEQFKQAVRQLAHV